MENAWQKTYGAKGSIWAAMGIIMLISLAFGIAEGVIKVLALGNALYTAVNVISYIINYLLSMGIVYIGVKRATGSPISFNMMFATFKTDLIFKVIGLYLLQILILIPAVLVAVIVPSLLMYALSFVMNSGSVPMVLLTILVYVLASLVILYIFIRIILAMAFVLDKKCGPWQAITQSFAATRGNVMRLIAIFLLQFCIVIISILLLLVGLIWSLPFSYILYGEVYKTLALNVRD